VLELDTPFRQKPKDLTDIYLKTASGGKTPLLAVASLEESTTPLAINHQGQFPVVTISFNLAPGVSLGEGVAAVDQAKASLGLPDSIQAKFQGTAQAFRASLTNTPLLILAALITVYIVLGVLYESYIHPSRSSRRCPLRGLARSWPSCCAAPSSRSSP